MCKRMAVIYYAYCQHKNGKEQELCPRPCGGAKWSRKWIMGAWNPKSVFYGKLSVGCSLSVQEGLQRKL